MKILVRKGMKGNYVGFDVEATEDELKDDPDKLIRMVRMGVETRDYLEKLSQKKKE